MLLDLFLPATPRRFARLMARAVKRYGSSDVQFIEEEFLLKIDGRFTMYLANAFEEFRRVPLLQRKSFLSVYGRQLLETQQSLPANFSQASKSLLPRLRERFYQESIRLVMEAEGQKPLENCIRPLNDTFFIEIVYDLPLSSVSLPLERLSTWDVDMDTLLRTACDNLWARSSKASDYMSATDLYPPRWRVRELPPPECGVEMRPVVDWLADPAFSWSAHPWT